HRGLVVGAAVLEKPRLVVERVRRPAHRIAERREDRDEREAREDGGQAAEKSSTHRPIVAFGAPSRNPRKNGIGLAGATRRSGVEARPGVPENEAMSRPLVVHVVGARPNYMKIAPLYAALERRGRVSQRLVHT